MWYDKMSDSSNIMSVLETIKLRRYINHLVISDRVYVLARRGVGANTGGRINGGRKTRCAAMDDAGVGKTLDISDFRYGGAVLTDFLIRGEGEGATTT